MLEVNLIVVNVRVLSGSEMTLLPEPSLLVIAFLNLESQEFIAGLTRYFMEI